MNKLKLIRVLQLTPKNMVGKDVEGCKRAVYRYLNTGSSWKNFINSLPIVRRTYGVFFVKSVKLAQKRLKLPIDGKIGATTEAALRKHDAFDNLANILLDQYAESVKPKPIELVKPNQGFDSLDHRLWGIYTTGRNLHLSDVGTYNSASRLPSGRPSDHAVHPARAFDLGFSPAIGENHEAARKFFNLMVGRKEVEYIILGRLIWSRKHGLQSWHGGGHESHVHTSGRR
jgi:hypothetical protein